MRVAIPVWHDRVAPVFTTIGTVVLYDVQEGTLRESGRISLAELSDGEKVAELVRCEISRFICGAIPFRYEKQLNERSVEVIPFTAGAIDEVVAAWQEGRIGESEFRMPGCKHRSQRGKNCRYVSNS